MKDQPKTTAPGHTLPSVRRSVGRPAIPVQRIIAAALRIIDDRGADALSMRSLAQQLNSSTATLYRHFSGRAQLVEAVIDYVLGMAIIGSDDAAMMTWPQSCRALSHNMFSVLSEHRNVAPLLVGYIPTGPNALARREAWIGLLLEAGFAPDIAVRAYATIAHYTLGFAMQLPAESDPDGAEVHEIRALDAARYPATSSVAHLLPMPLHDEFTFGLDLIIDGLGRLAPTEETDPSTNPTHLRSPTEGM
ncbi:TetR/AcrR family transcriptional regulator [Mycolicibacterium xanthum]|uniref:TetR/AcrR family transcriptional regulator n=1 Tax=Mycolicibacterium xanthum TaxID=2796469 RepID=UPI0027E04CED|nr:TetR/AcrR family transcriptional regulator [Mycolicibacterium xanthum]